mgnify:CR=1 FL=1
MYILQFLFRRRHSLGLAHSREYTSGEVVSALEASGFDVTLAGFSAQPDDSVWYDFNRRVSKIPGLSVPLNMTVAGSTVFAVAQKARAPYARYCEVLYDVYGIGAEFRMYPNGESYVAAWDSV